MILKSVLFVRLMAFILMLTCFSVISFAAAPKEGKPVEQRLGCPMACNLQALEDMPELEPIVGIQLDPDSDEDKDRSKEDYVDSDSDQENQSSRENRPRTASIQARTQNLVQAAMLPVLALGAATTQSPIAQAAIQRPMTALTLSISLRRSEEQQRPAAQRTQTDLERLAGQFGFSSI